MKTNIDNEIEATRKKLVEEQVSGFYPSQESLKKLKEMVNNQELRVHGKGKYPEFEYDEESFVEIGEWKVTLKERFGGSEGDGEEHYLIYEASQNGVSHSFWKVPGWYQSYNGGELEWENIHQVEAVPKMITDWEAV